MCVKRKMINQYSVDTNFTALISMTNVAVTSPTSEKKKKKKNQFRLLGSHFLFFKGKLKLHMHKMVLCRMDPLY
jgi:hypothetical protein